MNVDEAYYESAIPSNLFDDDIDVDDNDEIPTAENLGQQHYHHLETAQESINENKKTPAICDRRRDRSGDIENSDDEEEDNDDNTIKALAAAVKIVQSQQQEQPDISDEQEEDEMYGRKVRQPQEAEGKAERQVRRKFRFLLFQSVEV